MKIISFDVGIKNMAFCIFETNPSSQVKISDWKVLSLLGEPEETPQCNHAITTKKSKTTVEPSICGHKAKYSQSQTFLCDKHAKSLAKDNKWLLPEPRFKNVKKMKLEELVGLATSFGFAYTPSEKPKKPDVLLWVDNYLSKNCLVPVSRRTSKAGDADMVSLGQAMKTIFRDLLPDDISVVLIENQISPLANRMKTVQGMLAQYFIMRYEGIRIEFISSANKLKMFSKKEDKDGDNKEENKKENKKEDEEKTDAQKYKEHKKDGVFYCQQVLDKKILNGGEQWVTCERKKKDDLADCFLQGVWWLKREEIIITA